MKNAVNDHNEVAMTNPNLKPLSLTKCYTNALESTLICQSGSHLQKHF